MLARLAHALLGAVPASVVARSRTPGKITPVAERLVALVGRPLEGETVTIPRGAARGSLLRAERRSLAWITGKVEPEVQQALARLVAPGSTFVDVGAGIGFFTVLAGRLAGADGRVVAFEPDAASAAAIRANADLNGLDNVVVVPQALSDRDGDGFLEGRNAATAALVDDPTAAAVRVQTTTFDRFVAERPGLAPDVVKIDVEGHEAAVLRGMVTTLSTARPVLIVEMHGDRRFLSILEEAGYECSVVEGDCALVDAPWWAHVLAVPRPRAG